MEEINVADIIVDSRIRKDLGDVTSLQRSIKEFGVIQPIILSRLADNRVTLIAGGRRLTALNKLGITSLKHGREFVWREEEDSYTRKAVELEENLRRKSLSWDEELLAKKQLMELMVAKHGEAKLGKPSSIVGSQSQSVGFGVRKLAAMLGESEATTSKDLSMAEAITSFPILRKLPTKQDALRRLNVATTVVSMQNSSTQPQPGQPKVVEDRWKLYEGRFERNASAIPSETVDLICTDLPYNIGLGDSTAAHGAGLGKFNDSKLDVVELCRNIALVSYRVLKDNRYAVFFFGASYFTELHHALTQVGFDVDPYWFIWHRDRTAPPSPQRYAKTYDPALICSKGIPTLLRPNIGNYADIPSVRGNNRLHGAQKPVEIIERFILDMTASGSTCVDWMAGSGTLGVASLKNGRKAIMFELEQANCTIIKGRMAQFK